MRVHQICLVAVLGTSLSACAATQLVRPSSELIQLGKTTQKQVNEAMGTPAGTKTKEHNGIPVETFTYYDGARLAYFDFADGVLVGHRFDGKCRVGASGLLREDKDPTCLDFHDAEKTTAIIPHKSTRNDVEALLGAPSAEHVYPVTDTPGGRRLTYVYFGGPSMYTEVYVTTDRAGTVTEVRRVNLKEK